MILHRPKSWLTWLGRLALIAGPFLLPSFASACGRPMTIGRTIHPAKTANEPASHHEDGDSAPSPGRPFSGPNCSQQPAPLPAALALPPLLTVDRWGCFGD